METMTIPRTPALVAIALVVITSAALLVAYLAQGDPCEEWQARYWAAVEGHVAHTVTDAEYLAAYDARPEGCTS